MNNHSYHQWSARGFTLIELMVVIAIAAILMAVAVPSYMSFSANNNASDITLILKASINRAKNEAVRQGTTMKLCALKSDGSTNCGIATSWQYGWVIVPASSSTIIQKYQPNGASGIVISTTGTPPLSFSAQGLMTPIATFTFTIKPPQCTSGFQVVVGAAGQTTTTQVTCP